MSTAVWWPTSPQTRQDITHDLVGNEPVGASRTLVCRRRLCARRPGLGRTHVAPYLGPFDESSGRGTPRIPTTARSPRVAVPYSRRTVWNASRSRVARLSFRGRGFAGGGSRRRSTEGVCRCHRLLSTRRREWAGRRSGRCSPTRGHRFVRVRPRPLDHARAGHFQSRSVRSHRPAGTCSAESARFSRRWRLTGELSLRPLLLSSHPGLSRSKSREL